MNIQKMFNSLTTIHLELTSRCNKQCHMCGRRRIEKEYPELAKWGDMDYELIKEIAEEIPPGIVVQFHNNGESLLYPRFGEAIDLFPNNIRCMDTNGKLLLEKADEIIGKLDTLTISVIENDDPAEKEYQQSQVAQFLVIKGKRKPFMVYRLLGEVATPGFWKGIPGIVAYRTLHNCMGSFHYRKPPTIPEIGICLDLLTHLAIDRYGSVSPCVRFDPMGEFIIGDLNKQSLEEIWNCEKRQRILRAHIDGKRDSIGFCAKCHYWGVPTG